MFPVMLVLSEAVLVIVILFQNPPCGRFGKGPRFDFEHEYRPGGRD